MLIFSLIFYAWGEPLYILLLIFMTAVDWFLTLKIAESEGIYKRKRMFMALIVIIDLGLLAVFKYGTFILSNMNLLTGFPEKIPNIALPIGISFYTFQLLTYCVDVYRGEVPPQKSFSTLLLYVSMFHQCIAGPIVRYKDICAELEERYTTYNDIYEGICRFTTGLFKKALLANTCAELVAKLLVADGGDTSVLVGRSAISLWFGVLAFSIQIYLDFSAYSDMAIGMGMMTGFKYKENFDYPYCSTSITEFWRRWHISLGSFFRDYVYIPLGGNRKGMARTVVNLLITWMLTGFWHGASWNYVLWGLYYFVFLTVEKLFFGKVLKKLPLLFSHAYTLVVVFFGWVLFKFERLPLVWTVLKGLFCGNSNAFTNYEADIMFRSNVFLLIVACLACLPLARLIKAALIRLEYKGGKFGNALAVTAWAVYPCVMLLLSTAALVGNSFNPFLYFQF